MQSLFRTGRRKIAVKGDGKAEKKPLYLQDCDTNRRLHFTFHARKNSFHV